MNGKQVKKLPKDTVERNGMYFNYKYRYEPYTNMYGENVYVRFKRVKL